jgi:hypothetical protein
MPVKKTQLTRLLRGFALAAECLLYGAVCGGVMTERDSLLNNIPMWAHLNSAHFSAVINYGNGTENADIVLKSGRVAITAEGGGYYRSDDEWAVADFFVSDIDHDGSDEIMLHVWRTGSFGDFRPFWKEDEEDLACTEHLFIFDWDTSRQKRLRPMWMSSQMPVMGEHISTDDAGTVIITSPGGKVTSWKWGDWGLGREPDAETTTSYSDPP